MIYIPGFFSGDKRLLWRFDFQTQEWANIKQFSDTISIQHVPTFIKDAKLYIFCQKPVIYDLLTSIAVQMPILTPPPCVVGKDIVYTVHEPTNTVWGVVCKRQIPGADKEYEMCLFRFDTDEFRYEYFDLSLKIPYRCGFSCLIYGDELVVWGGFSGPSNERGSEELSITAHISLNKPIAPTK